MFRLRGRHPRDIKVEAEDKISRIESLARTEIAARRSASAYEHSAFEWPWAEDLKPMFWLSNGRTCPPPPSTTLQRSGVGITMQAPLSIQEVACHLTSARRLHLPSRRRQADHRAPAKATTLSRAELEQLGLTIRDDYQVPLSGGQRGPRESSRASWRP